MIELDWAAAPRTPEALSAWLEAACEAAFARGEGRVEIRVPAGMGPLRRGLHRAGFRQEGLLRHAGPWDDGTRQDVRLYARLDSDPVGPGVGHTAVMNTVTPRKRVIAHALLTDGAGRVALCQTSFKPDWELPGGIVEPGESPLRGCRREMVEEMGVAPPLDRILVVDWLRPYLGWEDAVEIVFGAPVLPEETKAVLSPDGHEILGIHWLDPAAVAPRMTPFGAARVRSALQALESGSTLYLEGGEPV